MNLFQYREAHGKAAFTALYKEWGLSYSQLYATLNGGNNPLGMDACVYLAECVPELDAAEIFKEGRANKQRWLAERKTKAAPKAAKVT